MNEHTHTHTLTVQAKSWLRSLVTCLQGGGRVELRATQRKVFVLKILFRFQQEMKPAGSQEPQSQYGWEPKLIFKLELNINRSTTIKLYYGKQKLHICKDIHSYLLGLVCVTTLDIHSSEFHDNVKNGQLLLLYLLCQCLVNAQYI